MCLEHIAVFKHMALSLRIGESNASSHRNVYQTHGSEHTIYTNIFRPNELY